jgi:hypothetical protein
MPIPWMDTSILVNTFFLSQPEPADLAKTKTKTKLYLDLEDDCIVPIDILLILKLRMLVRNIKVMYDGGGISSLRGWRLRLDSLFGPNIKAFAAAEKE